MPFLSVQPLRGRTNSVLSHVDWWTVGIYIALIFFGWLSVCGASYTYGDTQLLSFDSRSGMQLIWIGMSLVLALCLLLLDDRLYDTFAIPMYCVMMIVLFLTIFNPHDIKGSRSWIVLGPLRVQPCEFAKFITALAIAKLMSSYRFSLFDYRNIAKALGVIALPMLLIIMERETGSALVYVSFLLMLYREGLSGSFLFTIIAWVVYFVVGIRYSQTPLFDTPSNVGSFLVLFMIQQVAAGMVAFYTKYKDEAKLIAQVSCGITLLMFLFSQFVLPFNLIWIQVLTLLATIAYLVWRWSKEAIKEYVMIAAFSFVSMLFFFSATFVLNHIMQPHQRERINVLLGLDSDVTGAGYNVHQSQIAIGSGGLIGKGFLNGTQTKLHFVPEQDTDFIFCTVGEEEGFLGATAVLGLFLALILRVMYLAERQPFIFGRVYGYCVMSIFLFHLFINVGMVLGMTPVIGIPLPFFSYGGSSLWGFTILLFIFLRIDANRHMLHR